MIDIYGLRSRCYAASVDCRACVRHLRNSSGQTAVEYVIIAGMLMAAVAIMAVFLYTFREFGGRVLDLAASEYP
jgi:Flp pilus assembly pilin Flp